MPFSDEYITYILDQLAGLGELSCRRMFGGAGIYHRGRMFALIAEDVLYLKADDSNRPDFEAEGMGPFTPWDDPKHTMRYYEVPVDVLENKETLAEWAEKAYAVALKKSKKTSKNKKAQKKSKKKKT